MGVELPQWQLNAQNIDRAYSIRTVYPANSLINRFVFSRVSS